MADFLTRQWRRGKKAAGKLVDAALDVSLPSAGAYLGTLCGPAAFICVPAGAYAGQKLAGPAKRAVKKTGAKAADWLEWEEGKGELPPRPEDLPSTVVGAWGPTGTRAAIGEFEGREEPVNWPALVLVASAVAVAIAATAAMRR